MDVDDERAAIVQALSDLHDEFMAELERRRAFDQERRTELYALLRRGHAAGIGRKSMSKAVGMSLPSLREFLDGLPPEN